MSASDITPALVLPPLLPVRRALEVGASAGVATDGTGATERRVDAGCLQSYRASAQRLRLCTSISGSRQGRNVGLVALTPVQVRMQMPALVEEGRARILNQFGRYGATLPQQIKIDYVSSKHALQRGEDPTLLAHVDPARPDTIVVVQDHPYFARGDTAELQHAIWHEMLHLASVPYSKQVFDEEPGLLAIPGPTSFSDGVALRSALTEGVTDVLTERLTERASPFDYTKETAWADRVLASAGEQQVLRAYFGHADNGHAATYRAALRLWKQDQIDSGQAPPLIDLARAPARVEDFHVTRVIWEAQLGHRSPLLDALRERLIRSTGSDGALYAPSNADFDRVKAALQALVDEARRR